MSEMSDKQLNMEARLNALPVASVDGVRGVRIEIVHGKASNLALWFRRLRGVGGLKTKEFFLRFPKNFLLSSKFSDDLI